LLFADIPWEVGSSKATHTTIRTSRVLQGIVVQSLLFLPFHRTNPTPLRFRLTHVVLACTTFTPNVDSRYGLKFASRPKGPLTLELIRETVRLSMPPNYDPEWFASEANQQRIEEIIDRGLIGRSYSYLYSRWSVLTKIMQYSDHSRPYVGILLRVL
jgi:hypothetical protein